MIELGGECYKKYNREERECYDDVVERRGSVYTMTKGRGGGMMM